MILFLNICIFGYTNGDYYASICTIYYDDVTHHCVTHYCVSSYTVTWPATGFFFAAMPCLIGDELQ